jgi:hypothetical protein
LTATNGNFIKIFVGSATPRGGGASLNLDLEGLAGLEVEDEGGEPFGEVLEVLEMDGFDGRVHIEKGDGHVFDFFILQMMLFPFLRICPFSLSRACFWLPIELAFCHERY